MIGSIAFDGMHRAGKGTHISLTSEYLANSNIHNIIVRGEYYRHGSGNDKLTDPYSEWRQKNILSNNYDEKSNRLNRELFILYKKYYPEYLVKNKINNGIIIQDRSIVGKYLFEGEQDRIKNIHLFNKGKNIIEKKIIPDIIFILKPSKDILLQRLYNNYNPGEKNADIRLSYKEKYIQNNYEQYYNNINIVPNHIKEKIIILENTENKLSTQEIINNYIRLHLSDMLQMDIYDTGVKNKNQVQIQ